jgi:ribosome recycling factor
MIDETLQELQVSVTKAHDSLKRELGKLRTGRANPDLLDSVRVDYYGSVTPLRQLATISVPEPRFLVVKPFDRSQIKAVEKAIVEAELGLNPQNDGEIIRLPMPSLTEERRKDLVKMARKQGEDCKVAIRKARHDAKDLLEGLRKEGDASEDDIDRAMKKIEEMIQGGTTRVDEIISKKEKDILEV